MSKFYHSLEVFPIPVLTLSGGRYILRPLESAYSRGFASSDNVKTRFANASGRRVTLILAVARTLCSPSDSTVLQARPRFRGMTFATGKRYALA
jgi:hypothetical protein